MNGIDSDRLLHPHQPPTPRPAQHGLVHIREVLLDTLLLLGCQFRGPVERRHRQYARALERLDAELG